MDGELKYFYISSSYQGQGIMDNWLSWNWQKEISQTKHIECNTFIPGHNRQILSV